MTKLLTTAALDQWLARWRKLGIPYVDAWRPGLTYEQIDAVAGEHGVELAPELRTWWRWRDGTRMVTFRGRTGKVWVTPTTVTPWPLETALRQTAELRVLLADEHQRAPNPLPMSWVEGRRWLAVGVLGHGARVYADLRPSSHGGVGGPLRRARQPVPVCVWQRPIALECLSSGGRAHSTRASIGGIVKPVGRRRGAPARGAALDWSRLSSRCPARLRRSLTHQVHWPSQGQASTPT